MQRAIRDTATHTADLASRSKAKPIRNVCTGVVSAKPSSVRQDFSLAFFRSSVSGRVCPDDA